MSYTGADLFVSALEDYGVRYVFGNPGTTELPVMAALDDSDLEYRLALHEDIAVGMAAGYASTRRYHGHHDPDVNPVGVVNLHIAPGLAHGLGNLYGAWMTGAPLVVTAGNHRTDFRHEEPILGGDLVEMADQFTKWSDEVLDVDALPSMVRRAFRVALTPPTGPVFLSLPLDVMMEETDDEPEPLGAIPTAGRGDLEQIGRAADVLVEAEDPVLVVGDHVAHANGVDAAVALAEASGARVHAEMLAYEVGFPGDHEQWVSYIPPVESMAQPLLDTDTLVFVGCSTHTTTNYHEERIVPADARCVHVGHDAWQIGKNYPADASILGDPGEVMAEIAERVADRLPDEEREARLERVAEFKALVEERMATMGEGNDDPRASKAQLVDAMRAAAPDANIVDEGITSKYVMLARWPFRPEQYIGNKGGGLGYGLPATVGAAIAEEELTDEGGEARDVVGYVGDGSYLYYPHTLYSAARYDVDLAVVIPDNRNYRILKNNTLNILGGEEADYEFTGMDFEPPVDIPTNAESHGATGRLVDDPEEIESAVREAVAADGPVVLDVLVHD